MATLNAASRKRVAKFAIPASISASGVPEYPIHDQAHAVAALARVETNGTAKEKALVRNAVRKAYPNLPSSKGRGGSAAAKHNFAVRMGKQIVNP
jgi:hypothetical protein